MEHLTLILIWLALGAHSAWYFIRCYRRHYDIRVHLLPAVAFCVVLPIITHFATAMVYDLKPGKCTDKIIWPKKQLLVAALLSTHLSSCVNSLCEGRIVSKHYEPRRVYPVVVIVGKIPITNFHVDDEDWVFMVKGFNGKDTITERFEVEQAWWDDAVVGEWVAFRDC